jgi:hypothetical protein
MHSTLVLWRMTCVTFSMKVVSSCLPHLYRLCTHGPNLEQLPCRYERSISIFVYLCIYASMYLCISQTHICLSKLLSGQMSKTVIQMSSHRCKYICDLTKVCKYIVSLVRISFLGAIHVCDSFWSGCSAWSRRQCPPRLLHRCRYCCHQIIQYRSTNQRILWAKGAVSPMLSPFFLFFSSFFHRLVFTSCAFCPGKRQTSESRLCLLDIDYLHIQTTSI